MQQHANCNNEGTLIEVHKRDQVEAQQQLCSHSIREGRCTHALFLDGTFSMSKDALHEWSTMCLRSCTCMRVHHISVLYIMGGHSYLVK